MVFLTMGSVLMIAWGCKDQTKEANHAEKAEQSESNLQTIEVNGVPLRVEVAQTDEDRLQGLMNRDQLPEDQGMLFVFTTPRILSFWMRNTFIPLDIAFINEKGIIVDIQTMQPIDESKHYISTAPALYALEVNAGWFKKHKIKKGDQITF